MGKFNLLPPAGHYNANYGNFQTELYAQIRRKAFGEDIGQNSWLTADEQDIFWSGSTSPQGRPYSMLPAEQEVRRCASRRPPPVQVEPGNQWLDLDLGVQLAEYARLGYRLYSPHRRLTRHLLGHRHLGRQRVQGCAVK